jgi:hypothetical protein
MVMSKSLGECLRCIGVHAEEHVLIREIYESMIALKDWSLPQGGNGLPFCAHSIINRHDLVQLSYESSSSGTTRKVTFSPLGQALYDELTVYFAVA